MRELGYGRTVRLHTDSIDHRVGATASGHVPDDVSEIIAVLVEVDRLHPSRLRTREPFGHHVNGDYLIAQVVRYPIGHVADRPQPKHRHRTPVGNVGIRDCLPCRRQNVGQVDEP